MLFNHKSPGAKVGKVINFEGNIIVKVKSSGYCGVCQQLTHWMDYFFRCLCCSEECHCALWEGYRVKRHEYLHPPVPQSRIKGTS